MGPYVGRVFREVATPLWFATTPYRIYSDTYAARVLRKLATKLGLPITFKVRRYSMASGMDLESTRTLTSQDRDAINAVFPGAVMQRYMYDGTQGYTLQNSFYLKEQEDRSDRMTDYHDPGGDRIARARVPDLEAMIRATPPTAKGG
jgi:hypothetical protein